VRVLDLTEADLRAFRVGRDAGSGVLEFPLPAQPQAPIGVPPRDQPEAPPVADDPNAPRPPRTGPPGVTFPVNPPATPTPSTPAVPTPQPPPVRPPQ
jgi:hypothetical protein